MNKKQLSNLLGAGTITGFILALVMLLSSGNSGNAQGETAVSPTLSSPGITEVVPMENYNQLQAQNDQLVEDLQTMQAREQQIQAQITAANEIAAQQNGEYEEYEGDDDHDEYEEHENEYESDDD